MSDTRLDPQWQSVRNVLAIRLDNLGDVLVTTPALRAIRQSLPGARLTLLASKVGAQAGYLDPDVDDVIVYEAPWMDPWQRLPRDSEREQRMIATIRERGFDGALIFTSYHQSSLPAAYLCYLADVPLRVAASVDGPGSLLTTRHKHPDRRMHEVERGLDLTAAIGMTTNCTDLALAVPGHSRETARQFLRERGVGTSSGPLVVVHPGCSMPARTYPEEMFAGVVELAIRRLGATVVLTGVEGERSLVERVRGRVDAALRGHVLSAAGELAFPDFCALIERADLVITNNTGPMHVSAAVQTPVIALFALTNPPEQWGPWHVPHRLLYHEVACRLCYARVCPFGHECLTLVSPAEVIEAGRELLAETGASRQFVPAESEAAG